jgi:hypothetical protein
VSWDPVRNVLGGAPDPNRAAHELLVNQGPRPALVMAKSHLADGWDQQVISRAGEMAWKALENRGAQCVDRGMVPGWFEERLGK